MLLFQVSGLPNQCNVACMIKNYAHKKFLPVLLPATSIILSPDNDAPYAGTRLCLTCNYTQPNIQPMVTWMIKGRAVDTTSERISTEEDTLTFSPLATSDTGRYTCELTVAEDLRYVTVETPVQSEEKSIAVRSKLHGKCFVYHCMCVSIPHSPCT